MRLSSSPLVFRYRPTLDQPDLAPNRQIHSLDAVSKRSKPEGQIMLALGIEFLRAAYRCQGLRSPKEGAGG